MNQYFTGFAALKRPYNFGRFELVDQPPGAVVAKFQLALNERRTTLLVNNDQAGSLIEHGIAVVEVDIFIVILPTIIAHKLGQVVRIVVAPLVAYKLTDVLDFVCVDKRTL